MAAKSWEASDGAIGRAMKQQRFDNKFARLFDLAIQLAQDTHADGVLILLNGPTDWNAIAARRHEVRTIVAADSEEHLTGARDAGLDAVSIAMPGAPVLDRLAQALLESVADELLGPGADVVSLYSGFEVGKVDSISFIRLDEHLGRLTSRDLQKLETRVPLETLRTVVDLAVEIGREGREGKPIGTLFVVGDVERVKSMSKPAGFDPVRGYRRDERNLKDRRVREAVKEIAQLDGAILVESDGTVARACQMLDASYANITMTKGLGARHWAAAAISKATKAIAVVVSQSSGTVRLFQGGEVVLRIEPFERAMKWRDFEFEPPVE